MKINFNKIKNNFKNKYMIFLAIFLLIVSVSFFIDHKIKTKAQKDSLVLNDHEIQIKDSNLEKVIRLAIRKPIGKLRLRDVVDIKKLDASNKGIQNLDGIENLLRLQELDLTDNEIDDISALSSLKDISILKLGKNKITDIASLKNCSKLKGIISI